MRHEDFAILVAAKLDEMADTTRESEEKRDGYGIMTMRSNEMRVAAHMVRGLSEVATRKEEPPAGVDRPTLPAAG